MRKAYGDGLAEVYEILKFADEETKNALPEEFKTFIKENKSEYIAKIDPEKTLKEQELLYETKVILAVMYRDYWASPEERIKLIEYDKLQLLKKEMAKEKNYNYEEMFKDKEVVEENKKEIQNKEEEIKTELIVNEKFFSKILNKIKRFFKLGLK